jgi:hypothetical protein
VELVADNDFYSQIEEVSVYVPFMYHQTRIILIFLILVGKKKSAPAFLLPSGAAQVPAVPRRWVILPLNY